jgi:hypothetical protein
MELLMTTEEIAIPAISGNAKQITWRNFADPSERDSAMKGNINAATIAIAQIAALALTSFFFSDDVMTAILLHLKSLLLFGSVG